MILANENSRSKTPFSDVDAHRTERRRTCRWSADFVVEVEVVGREKCRAWAVDVGIGGMFLEMTDAPAYASAVFVTIEHPAFTRPLRVPGIVRWTAGGGFGVEFGLLGIRETAALVMLTSELSRFEEEAVTVMRMNLCS